MSHRRQRDPCPTLHDLFVPPLYSILQTESEILWEFLQFLQFAPHHLPKILHLGPEIVLDAEREKPRTPQHHLHRVLSGKAQAHEIVQLGDERVLHARDEEDRVLVGQRVGVPEPQPPEVEQGRPQLVADAGDQQPRALVDRPPEVPIGDAEVAGKEIEDRAQI
ncbi:tyrosine-protein kinase etk [Striga asiatica]|uniref:Tyrosine-protein kinase etk n=1 Tax=Striga asiatica TaxID=4170 RepID=A0A5A7NWD5_STRAF|nr:tyrosine-protein kinase etk [Striga asiatica]